jgi:hypothetical protein
MWRRKKIMAGDMKKEKIIMKKRGGGNVVAIMVAEGWRW